MTTDELEIAGRDPTASGPPSSPAQRRSGAIRAAIAVLLAAALTAITIVAFWGPLSGKTDVMGYPVFANFNPNNYANAYYLTVGLFPICALLIFAGLTWIGPRVGLAVPSSHGPLRPFEHPPEALPSPRSTPASTVNRRAAAGARVVVVGAILGLVLGVASNHLWQGVLLATFGYLLLVVLGSIVLGRLMPSRPAWEVRLAMVNCVGPPLTVGLLSLVSAQTAVRVVSNNSVHHYPWFPVWLGVPLAIALFVWLLVLLRRAGLTDASVIDRRAVLLISVPVALFVCVARLPGDSGPLSLYEVGQILTAARLVLHGWLPWRDIVLTHGILGDVVRTAVGWDVFGNSYWGALAGTSLILIPLTILATYYLLVYLVGRNWPILVIGTAIFLGTWLGGGVDARFLLWPIVLLLLAALLTRFTRVRAAALGFLAVLQAIVTPEMAAAVPILAVVLAAYEWYWQPPDTVWTRAFRGTIWFTIAAVVSAVAFAIYMASRGALGDVISVTLDLLAGHFGLGIPPTTSGAPQAEYDFIALAPIGALLLAFGYAAARLRLRLPFRQADWPMAVVALYLLFYYTKFLTRMDLPHAYQVYYIAIPLMVYIVYRAATAVEVWIRSLVSNRQAGWLPSHPVGIALMICFLVPFWGTLHTTVDNTLTAYRPTAPDPPIPRVGYAAYYEPDVVDDLRQIVNAYLGPHDRLMDLTTSPGLFYYFLDRDPSSPWGIPGGGLVDTPKLQRLLIGDLRRERPKLIAFDAPGQDSYMYGLPNLDGMPNNVLLYLVSRWILAHYRPLLESHGRTIYALRGLPSFSSLRLQLHQRPVTTGVPFLGQECVWGNSPTFLSEPAEPSPGERTVPARVATARKAQLTVTGWAGDLQAREPAREVIATLNGRIIGRSTPDISRSDVVAANYPAGFLHSGFTFSIPPRSSIARVKIFAIGRNGSVAQLATPTAPAQGGRVRIAGHTVTLQPTALTGHVDSEAPSAPLVRIEPPVGSTWADYRWLEVDAPKSRSFVPAGFTVSDQVHAIDPGHMIGFNTLASSPRHYAIPVSSCPQWHGYGSRPLFLTSSPVQGIGGIRLVR